MYFYIHFGEADFELTKVCLLPPSFNLEEYRTTGVIDDIMLGSQVGVSAALEELLHMFVRRQEGVIKFRPGLVQSLVESSDGSVRRLVCNRLLQDFFRIYLEVPQFDQETVLLIFDEDLEALNEGCE